MPSPSSCLWFSLAFLLLSGCMPRQEETWNSYYYGTERKSISGIYDGHPMDNDAAYSLPRGHWEDDQDVLYEPMFLNNKR